MTDRTNDADSREIIPGGKQRSWRYLIPIARFLIERGHPVVDEEDEYGFYSTPAGIQCELGRGFTQEDWVAVNDNFILPDNIVFFDGYIQDNINGVRMIGVNGFAEQGQHMTFDEWEERERRAGRRK